jgi:hypothetical protein
MRESISQSPNPLVPGIEAFEVFPLERGIPLSVDHQPTLNTSLPLKNVKSIRVCLWGTIRELLTLTL